MVTGPMADAPDIIIRTAEERENPRFCFAELRYRDGISLAVDTKTSIEKHTSEFLVFDDLDTAMLWAAVRTKELSREGFEIYWGLRVEEKLRDLPDERVTLPFKYYRHSLAMLEW